MPDHVNGLVIERAPRRVAIVWSGVAFRNGWRLVAMLTLAMVLVYWGQLAVFTWHEFHGDAAQRSSAAILVVMLLMSAYFIHLSASFAAAGLAYWRSIGFDAESREFLARRTGWLLWGGETVRYPFDSIRAAHLDLGPEGRGALAAELSVSLKNDIISAFRVDLKTLGLTRRDQGQELFFDIARVLSAYGYNVPTNSQRRRNFQLWMEQPNPIADEHDEDDDDEDETDDPVLPIPAAGVAVKIVEAPSLDPRHAELTGFGRLDIDLFKTRFANTTLEEWAPGNRVRLVRPAIPFFAVVLGVAILAGIGSALGAYPLWGLVNIALKLDASLRWLVAAFPATALGCLAYFLIRNNLRHREWRFDWSEKRLTLDDGNIVEHWPFDSIQSLVLIPREEHPISEDGAPPVGPIQYGARVEIVLPEQDLMLLETEKLEPDHATAQQVLGPLAQELAGALNTPCVRQSFGNLQAKSLQRGFYFTPAQKGVFLGLAALAIGLLTVAAQLNRRTNAIANQIRSFGVDIVRHGTYTTKNEVVCDDYWRIKLVDRQVLVDHGEEINKLLRSLPLVGLEAAKSNVTDADMAAFVGVKLCFVDVSNTKLTDAGLAPLVESPELAYLNADETGAGDGTIDRVVGNMKLKLQHLHLTHTRVTGAGYMRLMAARGIEVGDRKKAGRP